ncbi:double-stranded RNA-specific adenosine deaminase-like [Antedon mediterranea]|uniref:double-stranded RNA-specific adenosine deaminase-like n=1 Tax=Antedon mediterranea TaxID=105859 RepID=UPI003AF4FCA8
MSGRSMDQVLDVLQQNNGPMETREIIKVLGFQTKKEANQMLYKMRQRGQIQKVSESPPKWDVKQDGVKENRPGQSSVSFGATTNTTEDVHIRRSSSGSDRADGEVSSNESNEENSSSIPPNPATVTMQVNDQLSWKLLYSLSSQTDSIHANELAKAVGLQRKKEINPTLFNMQRHGLVKKVKDSPPLWVITPSGRKQVAADGSPPTGELPTSLRNGPLNFNNGFSQRAGSISVSIATSSSALHSHGNNNVIIARGSNQLIHDSMESPEESIEQKILEALSTVDTISTSDLVRAVGLNVCREINPTVYGLQKKGLARKVSESPPTWQITPEGKAAAEAKSNMAGHHMGSGGLLTDDMSVPMEVGEISMEIDKERFDYTQKNPISALTEYAQSRQLPHEIALVKECGPSHNPRFTYRVKLGGRVFPPAEQKNKKEARREAADYALRILMKEGMYKPKRNGPPVLQPVGPNSTFFDKIAGLAHQKYSDLAADIRESIGGRSVIASLIMRRGNDDDGVVVSLGTGNRCVTGDMLSMEGLTVNDSHAEIITRRAFIRFLYNELRSYQQDPEQSIFCRKPSGKLGVNDDVTFHLYISTAPCGDGSQFSRSDTGPNVEGPPADLDFSGKAEHVATLEKRNQGLLRTKLETGEGTNPIEGEHMQTWDGINRGERLRTMSCSDKIARWNVLGLQGALLSHFLDPLYMSSLTLGTLYHHGHLSRAVCCRLQNVHETKNLTTCLPPTYRVSHPLLGHVTKIETQRTTEKTKQYSINWFAGCAKAEVTDGTKGRCTDEKVRSVLCKAELFNEFRKTCVCFNRNDLLETDWYLEAKRLATDFQLAKQHLNECFVEGGYGYWLEKPFDEKHFKYQFSS